MTLCPRLFGVLIAGMNDAGAPRARCKAVETMRESLLLFKRTFSFPHHSEELVRAILRMHADRELLVPAYSVLRRCIDYFYPYMDQYMREIRELTMADLLGKDERRQIGACLLWSTVGEVESDIVAPDKLHVKGRHKDFDHSAGYSAHNFASLFQIIVRMIATIDPSEIQAHITFEITSSYAAFTCIAHLAEATDEPAVEPIMSFVSSNGHSEDWRLRYTSAVILMAATRLPSFIEQVRHMLFALNFFVHGIVDPIPRISETSMWAIGRMVDVNPDLVTDLDRFNRLLESITRKLHVSDELTSRACWLLSTCFSAFFPLDESSALTQQFEPLSDLLLQASSYFDLDSQEAAMGALSKLIERTPRILVKEYRCLLGKLTARLEPLLQPEAALRGQLKSTQLIVDLLALIQAIVMNVGAEGGGLLRMLVGAIRIHTNLAGEILPTIGALARAVKGEFAPYLEELLGLVFTFLESSEYVRPAAVFVSDVLCSGIALDAVLLQKIEAGLTSEFEVLDSVGYEAKLAVFTALSDLAKSVGLENNAWFDKYLDLLEQEARAVLNVDDESTELELPRARTFATVCLQIYQALVPVLARLKRGDRKVRNFFHIFEQLLRIDCIDDTLLADCVVLISAIAETFQRKMNVFLNKPAVLELLRRAEESESPRLADLGQSTWNIIRSF
jgi:importin subunit beta-1